MINSVGREVPASIDFYGEISPFKGVGKHFPENKRVYNPIRKFSLPRTDGKILDSYFDAFKRVGLKDGMTISFHHGLRNGDYVINEVLDAAAEYGLRGLVVATTGIFPCHNIVKHFESGVVVHLDTNGVMGETADYIANGKLATPIVIRSHGGRARAIECGDLHIDVAFVAASCADITGNLTGMIGENAFGALGYAMTDAKYADFVVGVTDTVCEGILEQTSILGTRVDCVVKIDKIGDPAGIATGSLSMTKDPIQLNIAKKATEIVEALGQIKEGYSFQSGGGGPAIAFSKYIKDKLIERNVVGGFCVGGINAYIVDMLENGVISHCFDTQTFDLISAKSLRDNLRHQEMSCDYYASPFNNGCIVNYLDSCILGAFEVDLDFNINCLTGMDGVCRTGIGGNPDTAAGSAVSIVTANLIRGRVPTVVDKVHVLCTPGESVDILVTDRGVAVNPLRTDIIKTLTEQGFELKTIEELQEIAHALVGKPQPIKSTDKVVAIIEYRDGTVLDVIKQVSK